MAGLFERFFKMIQAAAHSLLSRFEDPVKLAEQGIRDLKVDFDESLKGLAEVKAIAISTKRQIEEKTFIAKDYESKAMQLLQNAQNGSLSQEDADRLASEALNKKAQAVREAAELTESLKKYTVMTKEFETKIVKLKEQIQQWENEIKTLKARYQVAKSTKKINQQMVSIGSDSTAAMLEDMKNKINEEESLASAYGEMETLETDVDKEINKALGSSYSPDIQASLAEMKSKLLSDNLSETAHAQEDSLAEQKSELDQ